MRKGIFSSNMTLHRAFLNVSITESWWLMILHFSNRYCRKKQQVLFFLCSVMENTAKIYIVTQNVCKKMHFNFFFFYAVSMKNTAKKHCNPRLLRKSKKKQVFAHMNMKLSSYWLTVLSIYYYDHYLPLIFYLVSCT